MITRKDVTITLSDKAHYNKYDDKYACWDTKRLTVKLQIKNLSVCGCEMGEEAAAALATGWHHPQCSLQVLHVQYNIGYN